MNNKSLLLLLQILLVLQNKNVNSYYVPASSLSSSIMYRPKSSFVGSSHQHVCLMTRNNKQRSNSKSYLEMKKGKPNVPVNMRGNYKKMQEMQSMREQMLAASTPGSDGMPVFNLYVRTKRANVWYPAGSFKGDEKSAALAKSYSDDGFMSNMSKNQLDSGVSGSLYQDLRKLKESIVRTYPQLKKSRDDLEFGYKLGYPGLSEEKGKMNVIEPKESKGLLDNIKGMFG